MKTFGLSGHRGIMKVRDLTRAGLGLEELQIFSGEGSNWKTHGKNTQVECKIFTELECLHSF